MECFPDKPLALNHPLQRERDELPTLEIIPRLTGKNHQGLGKSAGTQETLVLFFSSRFLLPRMFRDTTGFAPFSPPVHTRGGTLLKYQVNIFKLREAPCLHSLNQYWGLILNNSVAWLNKSSHLLCSWKAAHCAVYTYL